jgi:small multidrug resistance pump
MEKYLMNISWLYLLIAIIFEVCGTSSMKLSEGLTKLGPTAGMFVFYGIGFIFLALALKTIDVSIAYAIWCGVGIVLITLIDYFIFKANLSPIKFLGIGLIVIGSVLLKFLEIP